MTSRFKKDIKEKLTDRELQRIYLIVGDYGGDNKVLLKNRIISLIRDVRQRDRKELSSNIKQLLKRYDEKDA